MGPRILTYRNNVSHLIGEQFICPRFMFGGGIQLVRWVVTNATYVAEYNKTYVQVDLATQVSS